MRQSTQNFYLNREKEKRESGEVILWFCLAAYTYIHVFLFCSYIYIMYLEYAGDIYVHK